MGTIKSPEKSLLFFAVMYSSEENAKKTIKLLLKKFGNILSESDEFNFNFTDFYENEFGKNLKKRFVLFEKKINREELAKIKIFSNKTEEKFSKNNKRTVNLDPGYLTMHNLILASCKEFPHRIYIGNGIYAEVEMMFKKGNQIEFPQYVYLDYKTELARNFFLKGRETLLKKSEQSSS
jgi:hypothetical protein